jgi:polysaccharide biosynthesis/export protein
MKRMLGLLSLILVVGCSTQPVPKTSIPATSSKPNLLVDQYFIGIDDRVTVNVWKNPDLSITVPVRPDGKISIPLVGEVVAGGKTPLQVAEDVTERLAKYIRDPQVAVILEELRSHEYLSRVRVTGAVRNPLSINFRQGMTILDVVLEAGGVNEFASANGTKLYRRQGDEVSAINIDLADILNDGDMDSNIAVQPGDIISVPERLF